MTSELSALYEQEEELREELADLRRDIWFGFVPRWRGQVAAEAMEEELANLQDYIAKVERDEGV